MQVKVKELAKSLEAQEGRQSVKTVILRGQPRPTQTKPGQGFLVGTPLNEPRQPRNHQAALSDMMAKVPPQIPNKTFTDDDVSPSLLSDEMIEKEYQRRFGLKRAAQDSQPPLPAQPPTKRPCLPPLPGGGEEEVPPGGGEEEEVSGDKMHNLLNELTTTMIKNEEDAAMALQVSNALTQALLNYRLSMLPDTKPKVPENDINNATTS